MQTVVTVPKEILMNSSFASQEVLSNRQDIEFRRFYLQRAQALGNLYRHKVDITYKLQNQELQRVQTTVWSVSEKFVILKGGIHIPIHAILKVEF